MPESKMTPPYRIKAKEVLDAIMAVKPSYGAGEFPPTEEQQAKVSSKVYHARMMIIYLALTNTAMEARSEAFEKGQEYANEVRNV